MKKRLVAIDNLKGILTLLVILGHVTVGLGGLANGAYTDASFVQKVSTIIYAFHMPLFFSLSGFFWKEKRNIGVGKRLSIMKNKVLALAVPYFLCSIAYFCIKYAMGAYTAVDLSMNDLLMIPVYPIEFFWYLYSLFTISILAELLDALHINKKIIVVVLAFIAVGEFVETDFMALYKTAENAVYFYLGSLAFDYKKQLAETKCIAVTGIGFILSLGAYLHLFEADNAILHFLLCTFIIGFSIGIAERILEREIPYITYIGKYSMPFYVIHVIFVGGIRIVLYRFGIDDIAIHLVGGFAGTTVVCYVLYRFILSKIKWIDFMFYPLRYIKNAT